MKIFRRSLVTVFAGLLLVFGGRAADGADVTRTILEVTTVSCESCLTVINTELRKLDGMVGMESEFGGGKLLMVDHKPPLSSEEIARVISRLGYPATVVGSGTVHLDESGGLLPSAAGGSGLSSCSTGGCNATAASWKKLYQRYFGRK